jgi:hypothetical protein
LNHVAGLSASALKDHARDLPVMNGIREDIKGIMALKQGSSDHVEALSEVVIRLHTLQVQNLQHSITCCTLSNHIMAKST